VSEFAFAKLAEQGFVAADQSFDYVREFEPWHREVAVPFWCEMAARADAAGLPVVCGHGCILWEDNLDAITASVWLLQPWTRMTSSTSSIFKEPWCPRATELESWQASKQAGPPAGAANADPVVVEASYRALLERGEVSAPSFRWEGAFRRSRRRRWRKQVALPWLVALVARADADGRQVSAEVVWAEKSSGVAGLKVELLDPQTRQPVNAPKDGRAAA